MSSSSPSAPLQVDPQLATAKAMEAIAAAMTSLGHQPQPNQASVKREADSIKIPPITRPTEVKQWERSVHQAVMAASGHDNQTMVSEWLYACSRSSTTPDVEFENHACPKVFQSLDAKLGMALDAAIRASSDTALKQRVDRIQRARQLAEKPSWGGRRLLWEILKHLGLSEDGESRRALSRLHNLRWLGDTQAELEKWNHEALLACDAADRIHLSNDAIVARLRECMEKSTRFSQALESWYESEKRAGGKPKWQDLMQVFGDRVTEWRSRLAEAEADGQKGPGPKPVAGTAEGGHPPPPPPGPRTGAGSNAEAVLHRFRNVCRAHVLHERCRNPNCPRDHGALSTKDLNALWYAAKELRPNEFRNGDGDATASGQTRKADIPLCTFLKSASGCFYGKRCQWPHDTSPEEQARAQKVRAARASNQSAGSAAGGIHAQLWDPDNPNPWASWNAVEYEAAW